MSLRQSRKAICILGSDAFITTTCKCGIGHYLFRSHTCEHLFKDSTTLTLKYMVAIAVQPMFFMSISARDVHMWWVQQALASWKSPHLAAILVLDMCIPRRPNFVRKATTEKSFFPFKPLSYSLTVHWLLVHFKNSFLILNYYFVAPPSKPTFKSRKTLMTFQPSIVGPLLHYFK